MSTKSSESVFLYLVKGVSIGGEQHLDENEEIEIVVAEPYEIDEMISTGKIWCFQTIAAWHMAKMKFPEMF